MLYLLFGTQQVLDRECHGLEKRLELYLDGKKIDLPEVESIVVLNIPCWGAGVKLWQLGSGKCICFAAMMCFEPVIPKSLNC